MSAGEAGNREARRQRSSSTAVSDLSRIRQEAVERAAEAFVERGWSPRPLQIQVAIDASGLITQLAEAIAQRDALSLSAIAWEQDAKHQREQLATERALCDRLAERLKSLFSATGHLIRPHELVDYDAHRAAERSEAVGS